MLTTNSENMFKLHGPNKTCLLAKVGLQLPAEVSGGGGRTWSKRPLLWPVNPAEPWALLPQDSGGGQVPVGGFLAEKLGRAPTVSRWAPQGVEWGLRPWVCRQRNLS